MYFTLTPLEHLDAPLDALDILMLQPSGRSSSCSSFFSSCMQQVKVREKSFKKAAGQCEGSHLSEEQREEDLPECVNLCLELRCLKGGQD